MTMRSGTQRSWPPRRRELEEQSTFARVPLPPEHVIESSTSTAPFSSTSPPQQRYDANNNKRPFSAIEIPFPHVLSSDMDHEGMTDEKAAVGPSTTPTWPPTRGKGQNRVEPYKWNLDSSASLQASLKRPLELSSSGTPSVAVKQRRRIPSGSMVPFSAKTVVVLALLCVLAFMDVTDALESSDGTPWSPRKGCHKVGHRRTISIPGCDRVEILLNACRGQCLSWAVPSPESVVVSPKFRHKVTSYSHCCRMTEHEEVTYLIRCEEGIRELRFPSALKCDCFDCSHHAVRRNVT